MVDSLFKTIATRLDLGGELSVTPVASGVSNETVVLNGADRRVLVRQWSGDRRGDYLPRELEISLWRAASVRGIAPSVLWADLDAGVVVSEYLDHARPWTAQDARNPKNWRRLGRLLARLNNTVHPLPVYSPTRSAARYLGQLVGRGLSAAEQGWGAELEELARFYERRFTPQWICHHDLMPENILETEDGGLRLIDFEYAGKGNPIFDWATLAAFAHFDEDSLSALREQVANQHPVPDLSAVVRLVRLLAYFWAQNQLMARPGASDLLELRDDLKRALDGASTVMG